MNQENKPCAKPCETCPFRSKYLKSFSPARDKKNAAELLKGWEFVRSGNVATCFEDEKNVCIASLAIVDAHVKHINKAAEKPEEIRLYAVDFPGCNLKLDGYLFWKNQPIQPIETKEIALPWPDPIFEAYKLNNENK